MNIKNFIKIMNDLHENCNSIFKSVSIAQAIEESGWGTSNLYKIANAAFGIKAISSWNGKVYSTKTKKVYHNYQDAIKLGGNIFRAYDTIQDSVIDHNEFLNNDRYFPVRNSISCNEACRQLKLCGYCPEDGYDTRLHTIISKYNLIQYDNLQFPFKIKVIYTGNDGINVRKEPNYKDSVIDNINGPIHYNDICTVIELVNGEFYKTKSGLYITNNPLYIEKI